MYKCEYIFCWRLSLLTARLLFVIVFTHSAALKVKQKQHVNPLPTYIKPLITLRTMQLILSHSSY